MVDGMMVDGMMVDGVMKRNRIKEAPVDERFYNSIQDKVSYGKFL